MRKFSSSSAQWKLVLSLGVITYVGVCTSQAQLASSFDVEALNSPQAAGTTISMQVTARSVLDIAIPLYLPLTDIVFSASRSNVVFANASGDFTFTDHGNGTATLSTDGLSTFDANGQLTFTVYCTEAIDSVTITVTQGSTTGQASVQWTTGPAHHIVFSRQPVSGRTVDPLLPEIQILDEFDNLVDDDARTIVLSLASNPSDGSLAGVTSKTTTHGVASWTLTDDLHINEVGEDYTMRATQTGASLPGGDTATSAAFTITSTAPRDDDPNDGDGSDDPNDVTQDTDDDGIPDDIDTNPDDPDSNNNGILDGLETDSDNDGLSDAVDPDPHDPDTDSDGILDGEDNCPTASNPGQLDTDNDGTGDACQDDDGDDIVNREEDSGPLGSDANNDGIDDSQQTNVVTLLTRTGEYITLVAPEGTKFTNVHALGNPAPDSTPAGVEFPLGFISFLLTDLPNTTTLARVQILLHSEDDIFINGYYNYGLMPGSDSDQWYDFADDGNTGAEIGDAMITLNLVDGQRGDADLSVNTEIDTLGGPANVIELQAPVGACGAGACGAGLAPFLPLMLFGLATVRTRRSRTRA